MKTKPIYECDMEDILRVSAVVAPDGRRWRRNGATMRWKLSSTKFRIPLKFGLYIHGSFTNDDLRIRYYHPDTMVELNDKPFPVRYP